jgi:hypothetical protein
VVSALGTRPPRLLHLTCLFPEIEAPHRPYKWIDVQPFTSEHLFHLSASTADPLFFIRMLGSGVELGPRGTSATYWPIVLSPGDYEAGEFGGMIIDRGNRNTRSKPAPVPLCPPQIPHDLTGRELGPPRWFMFALSFLFVCLWKRSETVEWDCPPVRSALCWTRKLALYGRAV